MAEIIKKPRGTTDYINNDSLVFEEIRNKLINLSFLYGCNYQIIPTFEESKLFHRSAGQGSDIVAKETFDLISKGDKNYTLRPEFTAGISRSVIENKLYASPDLPLRISYFGQAFRYERPQAGRLREFNQFGVEYFDNVLDINTIIENLIFSYYSVKEITSKDIVLNINYLGSFESRENYKVELKNYFSTRIDNMCDDCKRRYEVNPLRILDCKVPDDKSLASKAPKVSDFLTPSDKEKFEIITKTLDKLKIPYKIDNLLVRGLDYYTGLVWEINSLDNNIALGGGGQYSSLCKDIGNIPLEGIGFSLGIERLLPLCDIKIESCVDIVIIDNNKKPDFFDIVTKLRKKNYKVCVVSLSRSIQGGLKMADRLKAKYAIIIDGNLYKIKDLVKRKQIDVKKSEVLKHF